MTLASTLGLLASLVACAGLYFSSPNQRWLARSFPLGPSLFVSTLASIVALASWSEEYRPLVAVFIVSATLMASLIVLMFSGALAGKRR